MSEIIDNRAQRVRTLATIIQRLHSGEDPEQVRDALKALVKETDACEIMAMEQELIAGGMPVQEIQGMCDLHSQVTRDVLVQIGSKPLPPGHPADTMRRENEALQAVLSRMKQAADADAVRQAFNELMDIDKHYQRKEHLFFSCLERHGITGPSKVMWGKDDQVRERLKHFGEALRGGEAAEASRAELAAAVEEMIYKEDRILLPMCLDMFTDEEWAEIWASSPRYGWCLVEPGEGYRPPESSKPETVRLETRDTVQLPTGHLSLEQLVALFSTLPVDLTFVDAEDRVAFFSEGPDRIFPRSKAIVGRKVQYCHPPRSVDVVDRILDDFRQGRQDVAEFWIPFHGRFVHIRYFAVRDASGAYLGTLEVTQDLTRLRELEGERRLLQYEN